MGIGNRKARAENAEGAEVEPLRGERVGDNRLSFIITGRKQK